MTPCPRCGQLAAVPQRFCARCGLDRAPAPQAGPPPGWAPPPGPPPLNPPAPGGRRTGLLVGVGALVLVLLAGAAVGGWWLLGSHDDSGTLLAYGSPAPLAEPLDEAPTQAWEWETEDEVVTSFADGDGVVVSTTDGTPYEDPGVMTRLGPNGEETWRVEFDEASYGSTIIGEDYVVGFSVMGEAGFEVAETATGEVVWSEDGTRYVGQTADGVLAVTPDVPGELGGELRSLERADGEERWSADVELSVADSEQVAVLDGDRVRLLDGADGGEVWAADSTEAAVTTLALSADQVVLASEDGLVGLSRDDGAELWSADGVENPSVYPLTGGRVVVFATPEDADDTSFDDRLLQVYDDQGPVGEQVESSAADLHVGFELEGQDLLAVGDSLYDERMEVVTDDHDAVLPVAGGFYTVDEGGDLALVGGVGEVDDPVWTGEVDASPTTLVAVDGGLVAQEESRIVGYR